MSSGNDGNDNEIHIFHPRVILACFDGSEHSARALNAALSMASRYEAMLLIAHAIPFPQGIRGRGEITIEWDKFEKSEQKRIEEALKPWRKIAEDMGVTVEVSFLHGIISTAESLLQEAEKKSSDIIIGSRGLGGFRGLTQGSVSQAIAAHSKVPVMIVK